MNDPQVAESFCEKTLSGGLITNMLQRAKLGFLQVYTERGNFPTLSLANKPNTTFKTVNGSKQSKIGCVMIRDSRSLMPFVQTKLEAKVYH